MPLRDLLSATDLHALAGDASYERGQEYARGGRVHELRESPGEATASVRGREAYAVRLWIEDGGLVHSCTCPFADDGSCCKHVVALALVLTGEVNASAERRGEPLSLREGLAGMDKDELVELLAERAEWDDTLRRRLELRLAAGTPRAPPSLPALRSAIEDAIVPGERVGWHGVGDYDQQLTAVHRIIEDILLAGRATEALDLVAHALTCLERAFPIVDDSNGTIGSALEWFEELHLEACSAARPEPVALARRLYRRELDPGLDAYACAASRYAAILGPAGLAEYRALARADWDELPPLRPGEKDPERRSLRYRLTSVMLTLADLDGNLDARLAVMPHDLSTPYRFLQMAEACKGRGDTRRAVEWAERGLAAFPGDADQRLVELLAAAHVEAGRLDDAIAVAWRAFDDAPLPNAYLLLRSCAQATGTWDELRQRALVRASEEEGRRERLPRLGRTRPLASRSLVVELLLAEGDVDTAWREATKGGCTEEQWLRMARARAHEHPGDTIPVFLRELARILRLADRTAYDRAVELLDAIRTAMVRAGRPGEFTGLLLEVRTKHKRRRALLRRLDAAPWVASAREGRTPKVTQPDDGRP